MSDAPETVEGELESALMLALPDELQDPIDIQAMLNCLPTYTTRQERLKRRTKLRNPYARTKIIISLALGLKSQAELAREFKVNAPSMWGFRHDPEIDAAIRSVALEFGEQTYGNWVTQLAARQEARKASAERLMERLIECEDDETAVKIEAQLARVLNDAAAEDPNKGRELAEQVRATVELVGVTFGGSVLKALDHGEEDEVVDAEVVG